MCSLALPFGHRPVEIGGQFRRCRQRETRASPPAARTPDTASIAIAIAPCIMNDSRPTAFPPALGAPRGLWATKKDLGRLLWGSRTASNRLLGSLLVSLLVFILIPSTSAASPDDKFDWCASRWLSAESFALSRSLPGPLTLCYACALCARSLSLHFRGPLGANIAPARWTRTLLCVTSLVHDSFEAPRARWGYAHVICACAGIDGALGEHKRPGCS